MTQPHPRPSHRPETASGRPRPGRRPAAPPTRLRRRWRHLAAGLLGTALLAACGGGGGIDDGTFELAVEPASVNVSSNTLDCPQGPGPAIHVFGGVAPYTLRNAVPGGLILDRSRVERPGESFQIHFNGVCLTDMPVIVVDDRGQTVSVSITAQRQQSTDGGEDGSGEAAP